MSLYAIADTHLSFGTDKPMDSFEGWQDYTSRLKNNWNKLSPRIKSNTKNFVKF